MRITINDFENTFKNYDENKGPFRRLFRDNSLIKYLKQIYKQCLAQGLSGNQEVSAEQEFEIIKRVASYSSKNKFSTSQKAINSGLYQNKPENFMLAVDHLYRAGILTQENYSLIKDRQVHSEAIMVAFHYNNNSYVENVRVLGAANILNQQNFNALSVHSISEAYLLESVYSKLQGCDIAFNQEIFNKLNVAGNLQKIHTILYLLTDFMVDKDTRNRLINETLKNNILFSLDHSCINDVLSNLNRHNLLTPSNYLTILGVRDRIAVVAAALSSGSILTQDNFDLLFSERNRWLLSDLAGTLVWSYLAPHQSLLIFMNY